MIAIYRANPAAFQNNFNRMHTGVTLTFPTAEQLAAISVDETNREYDTQMAEWRASLHHGASAATRRPPELAHAAATSVAANNTRDAGARRPRCAKPTPTEHAVLTQRIASLEQSLAQIQQELKRPLPVQTPVARAPRLPRQPSQRDSVAPPASAPRTTPRSG